MPSRNAAFVAQKTCYKSRHIFRLSVVASSGATYRLRLGPDQGEEPPQKLLGTVRAAIVPIVALLSSVAFLLMGNGLQGTLLPVRANMEGFGAIDIGVLGSCYFVGFIIGCLYGPHLVRRAGHIRAFGAMVAFAACVVLGHALVVESIVWWFLRAGTGFCFAVLYMVIESWLNEKSTNENRGSIFSVYTIVNLTVITLGQLMLMVEDPRNFPLFAIAAILISLAAIPLALTTAQAPTPLVAAKIRVRHLYNLSPVGIVGCLAVGLANGTFWALGPVFAQRDGAGTQDVALFMSVVVVAGAIGQWPLGKLSDHMDRRKVIILSALGAALAGVGLVIVGLAWEDWLLIPAFLFGAFAFPIYALNVAHLNDFIKPGGYVEASGGLLLAFALGAAAGPLIASPIVDRFGTESLFAYTAAIHIALSLFTGYRMLRRAAPPKEEQIAFADALNVAQTVSTVDPLAVDAGPSRTAHGVN